MDYLVHNIAINLNHIRKAKGMSLDAVAEQTGVSKSMLAAIEKGAANPSIGVLVKIMSYMHYGIKPDIVSMAKALAGGMPIGAICAREEVAKAFTMGSHGTTFGGHPVCCAVLFYALVIVAVGLVLTGPEILASENGTGLVTADAMAKAMNSATMAKVIIIGGRCGIITSWNSFLMGGSRALYSMAESYMVPKVFAKLHPQYKTPVNALYLIGFLSILAPF